MSNSDRDTPKSIDVNILIYKDGSLYHASVDGVDIAGDFIEKDLIDRVSRYFKNLDFKGFLFFYHEREKFPFLTKGFLNG